MEDLIAWRDAALEAQRKAGNIAKQSVAMNLSNQDQWLTEHIPHRFRSCLVGLPLQDELMTAIADGKTRDSIKAHCLLSAVSEGRMAAIRWLIEFVGIRDFNGKPGHPKPRRTDVSITCIQGGEPIDPSSHDAAILAKVWKGCSQASGHPTQDTNHPPVDSPALDEALRIIVDHLKRTIYSASPDKLVAKTLVPLARTNC